MPHLSPSICKRTVLYVQEIEILLKYQVFQLQYFSFTFESFARTFNFQSSSFAINLSWMVYTDHLYKIHNEQESFSNL